jgi:lysophospholipase L1-like esterase
VADVFFFAALGIAVVALVAAIRRLHRRESSAPAGVPRTLVANALVLALLLCTLLAGVELWFRFGVDASDGLAVTRVGKHWYERHWRLNGVGVRDDVEYGERGGLRLEPLAGVRRLTFVGDSVTAAQGVPEVADRFANRIRSALGSDVEVQVFAQGGLETGDHVALLRDLFQRRYRTDLVVLVYFPNDITDLVPAWQESLSGILTDTSWLHAALRGSYALDFAWWRLHLLGDPAVRRYRETLRDAYDGEAWRAQQQRLLAIRDAVHAAGARFAVVTLPLFDAADQSWQSEMYARIDRFWRDAGVPHLDLVPRFAGRDPATLVASRWDEHPNAATHAEIADAILDFLRTQLRF